MSQSTYKVYKTSFKWEVICMYLTFWIYFRYCSIFWLYSFPIAVATNRHKLHDLKQLKFVILWFWKSGMSLTGLKSNESFGRAAFLRETLEENLFPSLFWLLEAAHIPWLLDSFLHLQSQNFCTFDSSWVEITLWSQPGKILTFQDHVITSDPLR